MLLNHQDLTVQDADVVAGALAHFRKRPALGFSACLVGGMRAVDTSLLATAHLAAEFRRH
jgi:hypothetical protein